MYHCGQKSALIRPHLESEHISHGLESEHISHGNVFFFWFINSRLVSCYKCWSQWPSGIRWGSVADRLKGLLVRIPPGAWMSVSCKSCVSSGRGLSSEPIPLPQEVCHCVRQKASRMRKLWSALGYCARGRKWYEYFTFTCYGASLVMGRWLNWWMYNNPKYDGRKNLQVLWERISLETFR